MEFKIMIDRYGEEGGKWGIAMDLISSAEKEVELSFECNGATRYIRVDVVSGKVTVFDDLGPVGMSYDEMFVIGSRYKEITIPPRKGKRGELISPDPIVRIKR